MKNTQILQLTQEIENLNDLHTRLVRIIQLSREEYITQNYGECCSEYGPHNSVKPHAKIGHYVCAFQGECHNIYCQGSRKESDIKTLVNRVFSDYNLIFPFSLCMCFRIRCYRKISRIRDEIEWDTMKEFGNKILRFNSDVSPKILSDIVGCSLKYARQITQNRASLSESVKVNVRDKYNHECIVCGRQTENCHHIIPMNDGGEHTESNMVTLCDYCHLHIGHNGSFQNSPFDSVEEFWSYIEDCKFSTEVTNSNNKPVLVSFLDKIENEMPDVDAYEISNEKLQKQRTIYEYKRYFKSEYVGEKVIDSYINRLELKLDDWIIRELELQSELEYAIDKIEKAI